jgi:hypothetical protein
VTEVLSSVFNAFDRVNALFAQARPCGISSLLVHVTVVPAFTVKVFGSNVKLEIDAAVAWAFCAKAGGITAATIGALAAPNAAAMNALRTVFEMGI